MEGLCWDYTQDFTYTTSTLWTNQENQDALIASNPSSCLLSGKNTDLADDIFIQDQPLQHAHTSQNNLNSNRLQETSGLVTSWVDTSTQDFFSSSFIETGFGSSDQSTIINGLRNGNDGGFSTGSFESLDCLLSATNSTTDTSVEDDSISMIFSACRNLWKHGNKSVASSAESEGEIHCRDEGTSSYQTTKTSVCAKRSKDQSFDMIQTSKPKRQRSEKRASSTNINFQQPNSSMSSSIEEADPEAIAQMKEMIYRAAAFRPVNLGIEVVEKPKRKNVKVSCDPQTVAARQRRERISERIRVLQRLVPGGTKMDTASMLDEAANYLKFLRSQVKALENFGHKLEVNSQPTNNIAFSSLPFNNYSYSFHPMQTHHFSSLQNPNHIHHDKVGKD